MNSMFEVKVPSKMTQIEDYALFFSDILEKMVILSSVTTIGKGSFKKMSIT